MVLSPQAAFIVPLVSPAIGEAQRSGLSAGLMLAQAALESSWGTSELARKHKNLFGIKADSGWSGPSVMMPTTEEVNGRKVRVMAPFRVYSSWAESFADRTQFLRRNPRYARAGLFDAAGDPRREAEALKRAGYATDSGYVQKLLTTLNGRTIRQALSSIGQTVAGVEAAGKALPLRSQLPAQPAHAP